MPRIINLSKHQILLDVAYGVTLSTHNQVIKFGYATFNMPLHFDCADGVHKLILHIEVEKK